MDIHQLLHSFIPICRSHLVYWDNYKKIDEIKTAYGEEVAETVKKMSIATGLCINDVVDNLHSFLANYGVKTDDAVQIGERMSEWLEVKSFCSSNNWKKMHGIPMCRKGSKNRYEL